MIPASVTPITVTGRYVKPDGSPAAGIVRFQLSAPAAVPVDRAMVPLTSVKATLDAAGSISVVLAASDDPEWAQDGLTYQVTERIVGADLRVYNVTIPAAAAGSTVDLSALAPAVAGPALVSYVLAAAVGAPSGVASLDATGQVPLSQLGNAPGGGGGGTAPDATSTIKGLVQLAGDLAGTAAAPTVPGLAGKVSKAGDTMTGSLALQGTAAGGFDTSDSTARLGIQSYQTNGVNFFGEGVRLDLMRGIAKNMIAWRLPRPANSTDLSTLRSVCWIGAHYYAQDQVDPNNPVDVHGHFSIEVPDASDALRTRFEILFADPRTGVLGLDKTLARFVSTDLVLDTNNNGRLRLHANATVPKWIEFANDQWGQVPRWVLGVEPTAESGGNAGSGFRVERFRDDGVSQGFPIQITRSNGRTIIGGSDGSQSGLDVNRNSFGNAIAVGTTANGATALRHKANDATSVTLSAAVGADTVERFAALADGKHEWGSGSSPRDTNLYRSSVGTLKTDSAFAVGGNVGFYGAAPAAKPTVSGVRNANPAVASLLSGLAGQGLIIDSTTLGTASTVPTVRRAYITTGDVTLPANASWTALAGFELQLPAVVGDYVELHPSFMHNSAGSDYFDLAVLVGTSIVRRSSTGTASATVADEGDPALYANPGTFRTSGALFDFVVTSGDLDGGNVRFALIARGDGGAKVFASSSYPYRWRALNHGPVN